MHLFYDDQTDLSVAFNSGNNLLSLSGDEAAHLKVLRMKPGDQIWLTDGLGHLSKAEIDEIGTRSNIIRLTDVRSFDRPAYYIHIAVAPPKNIARFEWFLEKATECGIDEITPLYCEHSERAVLRVDRLNKVIVSAMKQSLKTYIPKLNEPESLTKFLNRNTHVDNAFIAWLDRDHEQHHLKAVCKLNLPVTVLIGPEGDFSSAEVELAKDKGYAPVSLGRSRLRTETAALAACFIANMMNEPDKSGYPISIE